MRDKKWIIVGVVLASIVIVVRLMMFSIVLTESILRSFLILIFIPLFLLTLIIGIVRKIKKQPWPVKSNLIFGGLIIISVILLYIISIPSIIYDINDFFLMKIGKVYTYHGLRVPVKLDDAQVSESLMNKQPIKIKKSICSQIIEMAKEDNWQILDTNYYLDGGSVDYALFKDKDQPAVKIFCKYEMALGKYSGTIITFIHPARIGSWLLDLNSHPKREGGWMPEINVEQLMDCDGTPIRGQIPETVECVKK